MRSVLSVAALVMMSVPALAGDGQVASSTLSDLGLSGMQVMTDAEGMQVRGLSSSAAAGGTSLVFGQLTFNDDGGTSFVAGSDVNTARGTSHNYGFHNSSKADVSQSSGLSLALDVPGFSGSLSGSAGQISVLFLSFGGYAKATGY